MTTRPIARPGACPCGTSRFTITGKPLARFHCHCTLCQAIYQQPFADVTAFWAGAIEFTNKANILFKRFRLPPALRRGLCESCKSPVAGFLTLMPLVQLAFVPSRNVADQTALPPPAVHIFYHRRVQDSPDALPKVSGYWASELAVTRLILRGAFSGDA